ncbi:putative acyl-CoA dehydrogenase FadE [Planotetraspora thailandica]|uniref:Putative acyl-CoA dehydrogenase FadE n=1 Tax=Planotetraspora thailandica TaxID=487172 RepID=A0A8J3XYX3_9ACTN|nr:acyl-CoA dehydrogenase [Planotetraspora thailandica]GII55188.1 putative acyl-CoA dehydrogenase FadE [Planotetraspora thailandica]
MTFPFTDEQIAYALAVREVLARHCPAHAVGEAAGASHREARLPAWPQLAAMGFFGALVPQERGGLGRGLADVILAFEETGRAALPGPVVETAAVGPLTLDDGDLLARLAAGRLCVSARLGDQVYVPDADLADLLVMERRGSPEQGDGEPWIVPAARARCTPEPGIDPVRRLFSVTIDSPEDSLGDSPGDSTGGVAARTRRAFRPARPALRAATVAVAAQLVGLARRVLEVSTDYARRHKQFGVPVAAFQAIKRRLADVAVAIDLAASLVYAAAEAVHRGSVRHGVAGSGAGEAVLRSGVGEVDRVVSAAKAAAGEAAASAATMALKVYGADGYAGEPDLKLWLARVWSLASAYGDTGVHRLRTAVMPQFVSPTCPWA